MRAILVLASITLVAYGVLVFLMTLGFATQVEPGLSGSAWREAVLTRLFGNLKVGLFMSAGGFALGVGLYLWAQRAGRGEDR